jgi:uncharacterized membrane protein
MTRLSIAYGTFRLGSLAEEDAVESLGAAALVAATITMGVMAGVFQLYSYTVMPGLGRTDDRTFVGAFQALDRAIINPLFMANFLGALVFTALAAVLHTGDDERDVLPWIAAAFVLYLVTFVITIGVNVPMNDRIKAAGNPDRIANLAEVRRQFDEAKWRRWNLVRSVLTTVAVGCLAWALVEHGRI